MYRQRAAATRYRVWKLDALCSNVGSVEVLSMLGKTQNKEEGRGLEKDLVGVQAVMQQR